MKEELQNKLKEKHPNILSDIYIECGDGWYDLIENACNLIGHYLFYNKNVPKVKATQIKEKFGVLRFYVDGGDSYTEGIIRMAETYSHHVCEECGEKGKTRSGTWLRTLCDYHAGEKWKQDC